MRVCERRCQIGGFYGANCTFHGKASGTSRCFLQRFVVTYYCHSCYSAIVLYNYIIFFLLLQSPSSQIHSQFADKYASDSEQFVSNPNRTYSNHTKPTLLLKNIIPRTSHGTDMRNIGTHMTPITPPTESTSPIRHNTPASKSGLLVQTNETVDIAKLKLCNEFDLVVPKWSSREEEEEDVSKSLRHFEMSRKSFAESRACAWEEEERSKSCMRYHLQFLTSYLDLSME